MISPVVFAQATFAIDCFLLPVALTILPDGAIFVFITLFVFFFSLFAVVFLTAIALLSLVFTLTFGSAMAFFTSDSDDQTGEQLLPWPQVY